MAGVQPASEEELRELAVSFNQEMTALLATPGTSASWYKLFNFMDQDKSGRVTYIEVRDMVRSEVGGLGLQPARLPEPRLRSLWRALDDDGSGFITVKEFGKFMKAGEVAANGPGCKERRTAKLRVGAEETTRRQNEERDAMAGVQPASEEEVRELSRKMHACMVESKQSSW